MADIVLAEFAGQTWLVRGEQHIDHLLANTLARDVSIEVVTCDSKSAVDLLWRRYDGASAETDMMWLIHPAVANRARGQMKDLRVVFSAWSASLDDAALAVVGAAAEAAADRADSMLTLIRYVAADGPAMALDLANLRTGLLEARLASLGVAPSRFGRETRAASDAGEAERIDLIIRER
jgi:hypothetical protein